MIAKLLPIKPPFIKIMKFKTEKVYHKFVILIQTCTEIPSSTKIYSVGARHPRKQLELCRAPTIGTT